MKPRVLFVQPSVSPPGGGNGVAAWMLHHLASRCSVTLLSQTPLDAPTTDEFYGTSISKFEVHNVVWGRHLAPIFRSNFLPTGLLKIHLIMRAGRQLAARTHFDLICSAFDEQDYGQPCIEYIHYPWNLYPRPDAPPNWNDSFFWTRVTKAYNWVCRGVSGFRVKSRPANLTLVNSDWTGRNFQQVYPGHPYRVLFPPALSNLIEDDRPYRQSRFLSVGRIAPAKEWLKLVDIVAELRRKGHQVGLTLAGSRDDREYEAVVRERISREGDWVRLVTDFTRDEAEELMRTHAYGLHGMKEEHYGMAVAELVLGGCLTMVPAGGGQVEIVTDPRLHYSGVSDAVEKWDRILSNSALERELTDAQMAERSALTRERFLDQFSELVDDHLRSTRHL